MSKQLRNLLTLPIHQLGLVQALGVTFYIIIVSFFMANAESVFGQKLNGFLAPVVFLLLFSVSALVCAIISFGYPFLLFWEEKKPRQALCLVGYTAGWLIGIFVILFGILLLIPR